MSNKAKIQDYQQEAYGYKILKGISSDEVLKLIEIHPLLKRYYNYNETSTQQRIIDTLMREPSKSDCPGFIYGFRNKQEYQIDPMPNIYDIKLGRTKRQIPQQRIYQWQKEDKHQYVEIFTVRSQHNNKLQSLVHLFFAYARKTKYVDGKRRIQWFSFNEKTLTAATVNLIDCTMEKVHQIAKANQVQKIQLSFNLENWLQSVKKEVFSVVQMKKRLLLFGFKKNGKTVLKRMFNSQELICSERTKNFCIINLKATQQETTILQIQFENQNQLKQKNVLSLMKEKFLLWSNLFSTRYLTSCLVIKQADLFSSNMSGLRLSIDNLKNHIYQQEIPQNLIIVVTHCDPNFGQKDVQQILKFNSQLLNLKNDQYIKKAKYFFISKPESTGKFKYDISSLIEGIQSNQDYISFNFKQSLLIQDCQKIIRHSYEDVAEIYQKATKKRFAQIQQQIEESFSNLTQEERQEKIIDQKLEQMLKLQQIIKKLKEEKTQVQIFKYMKYLHNSLKLSSQKAVYSQFYVFCQCIAKSNLNYSIVFVDIEEQLKKHQDWIRQTCNSQIQKIKQKMSLLIKSFYQGLKDQQVFNQVFKILTSICESYDLSNIIQQLFQLNQYSANKDNFMSQVIESLLKMKEIQTKGINIINLVARIHEAIFLGTKNRKIIQVASKSSQQKQTIEQKQIKKVKEKKQTKKASKTTNPQPKIDEYIKKAQSKNELKQVIVISSDQSSQQKQKTDSKKIKNVIKTNSQKEMIDFNSPNLNEMLIQYSKNKQAQQKQFLFNSFQGEFLINLDDVNILKETIIFAKTIKFVQNINVNFIGQNKKRLILVAENYIGQNMLRINNIKSSTGCLILLKNRQKKQYTAIDQYHRQNVDKFAKLMPKKFIDWYCLKIQ